MKKRGDTQVQISRAHLESEVEGSSVNWILKSVTLQYIGVIQNQLTR